MSGYDVIIVGAGAAGLMAARELSKAGKTVVILEARNRIGGRMHSLTFNSIPQHVEAGAEFIHGNLPFTIQLLKEAGINYVEAGGEIVEVRHKEMEEMDDYVETDKEFRKKLEKLETDMTVDDFLETYFSEDKYANLRKSVIRFIQGYEAADTSRASILSMKDDLVGNRDEDQYRVEGGYKFMYDYLLKECIANGCMLHFLSVVKHITSDEKQVNAITAGGESYSADQVLITVPLGVLQADNKQEACIDIPVLSKQHISLLRNMGYGQVIKILLAFNHPFWQDGVVEEMVHKNMDDVSFIFSDAAIPTWWTQIPQKSNLLTGWLAGPRSLKFRELNDGEILDKAIHALSLIFKLSETVLRDQLTDSLVCNWPADPFSLGAYSYPTLYTKEAQELFKTPVNGNIYFAGEAFYQGPYAGTVEASLTNAINVSHQMLNTVN